MKRCARYGTGWLPYMYTPERLAGSLETIARFAEAAERSEAIAPGILIFFAVHDDRERAIRMATDTLSTQYQQDFSSLVGKYALAGDPEDCIARLREFAAAGARTVILNSACPGHYMAENESLLAKAVLPAFESGG